jgi:single-strand DNA-binding protein
MNNVSLVGRFSADPELRYTDSGKAVCSFTLAVRNPFDPDGNADFIRCVAWGQAGEMIAEQKKGTMIGVTGRIRPRSYENNEGQTVYTTEVIVNDITFTQSREQSEQQGNRSNNNNNNNNGGNNRNRSNNNNNNNNRSRGNDRNSNSNSRANGGGGGNNRNRNRSNNNQPIDINDDDLPF